MLKPRYTPPSSGMKKNRRSRSPRGHKSNRRSSSSDDYRRKHHRDRDRKDHRRKYRKGSSESDQERKKIKMQEVETKRREEALQRSLEEARRQAEEAQRDDCTVLVSRIHLNVDERAIFKFFSASKVGKIRDVRLIRDQRSGKSKGIAYVEFYTPESVLMAMAMSG